MKRTRARSFLVLMLTLAFFAGIAYFVVNLVIHSSEWVSQPYNGHLADSTGLEFAGKVLDRNGIILAQSRDKQRIYHEDEAIRRACLHVVGDDSVNIATSVQTLYRSELSGYDFSFGLGIPDEMKEGKDIRLTIDCNVQKAAYEALGDQKGACVVYNYRTGEILCLVSTPAYDPMDVPEDIDTNDAYEGAYLNRAISASYPPGSTFKLVTAAAALENDPDSEHLEYDCTGSTKIDDKVINCFQVSGHIDMKDAIKTSCNAYFAELALSLGKEKMTAQAEKMGFNHFWQFDGIQTTKCTYDVSEANDNNLGWSGVGQYTVLESPMNMAIRASAIANGGMPVIPKLIQKIDKTFSGSLAPVPVRSEPKRMMSQATADKLKEMMDYTVAENYGKSSFSDDLNVCAKTGTAEISDDGTSHGWVTGFTTDEDCPLAFAVIVERGNSGFYAAVPVASAALNAAVNAVRSA